MDAGPIPLDLAALRAAAARIAASLQRTPQPDNEPLSRDTGAQVQLKRANLQRTGSFKIRGATHKIACLLARGGVHNGVIAASAGNHAQGVARAARLAGLRALVVMPANAPLTKIEACRGQGAEVRLHGDTLEGCTALATRLAGEEGLAFLHPYDDWEVIAGQASCGLEILEDCPDLDTVVVPLGGGGLISGIALAIKLQRPQARIVGVQADGVAPWRHFLADGKTDDVAPGAHTIADGIKVKRPGECTRAVIARHVDDIVTVDDNAIAEAIVMLLERTRTIGEGAGVVGLAALMRGRIALRANERVVVVVSGGNVDMSLVGRSIDYGLAASGRLMCVAVTVSDTPGRLAALLADVAALGMNVRHVEHRRGELHVPVGFTQVILQAEARDFAHQRALLERLSGEGIAAQSLIALPAQA